MEFRDYIYIRVRKTEPTNCHLALLYLIFDHKYTGQLLETFIAGVECAGGPGAREWVMQVVAAGMAVVETVVCRWDE